jgi:pyruvate dehydrogenase E2 component (dihydrolipoamide acetyltransferase)
MRQLVNRGNEGNFAVSDLRGGTFTITNYGAFAGVYGRPMILPPQVAILGLGRIHEAPVVKNGEVIAAKVLPISLVFDHRALDGAPAAAFLADFMSLLTSPGKLLVSL